MLSIPCWFIKLSPSQDEIGLSIGHVNLKWSRGENVRHYWVFKSNVHFKQQWHTITPLSDQQGQRSLIVYIALARMCGKWPFYTMLEEVWVGRAQIMGVSMGRGRYQVQEWQMNSPFFLAIQLLRTYPTDFTEFHTGKSARWCWGCIVYNHTKENNSTVKHRIHYLVPWKQHLATRFSKKPVKVELRSHVAHLSLSHSFNSFTQIISKCPMVARYSPRFLLLIKFGFCF